MTGEDFMSRLDGIVEDLQSPEGRGKTVNVMLRNSQNQPQVLPLSSDAAGVINAAQFATLEAAVIDLANFADQYITDTAAYTAKAAELKVIAESPAYIAARASYKENNVSENYAELQNAKGSYVV